MWKGGKDECGPKPAYQQQAERRAIGLGFALLGAATPNCREHEDIGFYVKHAWLSCPGNTYLPREFALVYPP